MNDLQLLPVDGEIAYTFDFSDVVIAPATLVSVSFTASTGVTLFGQSDDLANLASTIGVKLASHGVRYTVQALGSLSNGEKVVKDASFVGFNA